MAEEQNVAEMREAADARASIDAQESVDVQSGSQPGELSPKRKVKRGWIVAGVVAAVIVVAGVGARTRPHVYPGATGGFAQHGKSARQAYICEAGHPFAPRFD